MKEKILMVVTILVLSSVLTSILLAVDFYTEPLIEKNNQIKKKRSILEAFGIPYSRENLEEVYSANITEDKKTINNEDLEFFRTNAGETAFAFSGSGLWGPIEGILALEPDLKTIKGITIIKQEETPGLGGRITEPEYLDRFVSKLIVPELIPVAPGTSSTVNEVDTITGATMTCNAFMKLLNEDAERYLEVLK
jgi:Na+-transporting NADH:ubiquinone oxidoreductase subunit C